MIKVLAWNARCLDELKQEEIINFMRENNVYIVGISESWRYGNDIIYDKSVNKIRRFGLNHPNGRRGVVVYTRTELKIKYDMDFCLELEECEMITAHIGDLTIVFTYLANGRKATGLNCMIEQIEALYDLYDKVIVMGDFNTRMCITPRDRWNESGRRLSKYLKESSFSRVPINWATFLPASTCLDHCITTHMDAISDWGIIERSFD